MANIKKLEIGATPGKVLVAIALAVALIVVLSLPDGDEDESADAANDASPATATTSRPAPAAADPSKPPLAQPADGQWPAFSRQQVAAYDPFAVSPRLIAQLELAAAQAPPDTAEQDHLAELQKREQARQEFLTELHTSGVGMLFQNRSGSVAKIGSRTVRVGDVVQGFRVVEIGRQGVVLEPAPLDESQTGSSP